MLTGAKSGKARKIEQGADMRSRAGIVIEHAAGTKSRVKIELGQGSRRQVETGTVRSHIEIDLTDIEERKKKAKTVLMSRSSDVSCVSVS